MKTRVRSIFIDGVKVDVSLGTGIIFTHFKMVDGNTKRVLTYDYDREIHSNSDVYLCSAVNTPWDK